MKIVWTETAWQEYVGWQRSDPNITSKINDLVEDIRRDPTAKGMGRPERLKGDLAGWSARRITNEHRLVYRVVGKSDQQFIEIIQCKGHY
jgi:toxin YoeB